MSPAKPRSQLPPNKKKCSNSEWFNFATNSNKSLSVNSAEVQGLSTWIT